MANLCQINIDLTSFIKYIAYLLKFLNIKKKLYEKIVFLIKLFIYDESNSHSFIYFMIPVSYSAITINVNIL